MASLHASEAAIYSALVEELDMAFCLCDDHEIGDPANVKTQSVVDLSVSVSPS